jgi:hypothetical protein
VGALEVLVFASIAVAVVLWAVAEVFSSRVLWSVALGLALLHSAVAFIVFYGGSHAIARDATMRQTAALTGVSFPGGIYVNYVFLAVWSADAAWWWLAPRAYEHRARWISAITHGFIFFIMLNGAVIFADGWARVIGVVAIAAVVVGAWHRYDSSDTLRRLGAWHRYDNSDSRASK